MTRKRALARGDAPLGIRSEAAGGNLVDSAKRVSPSMGLAEAVDEVVEILRGRPAPGSADGWARLARLIADHDCLPGSELESIEKAIAKAYRGWLAAQRRSIWYETDSGMTDDDDDGIGYWLHVEMLDEVTRAAWKHVEALKKAAAERSRRQKATR